MVDESQRYTATAWPMFVGGEPHLVHQPKEGVPAREYYRYIDPATFLYWTAIEAKAARDAPDLTTDPPIITINKEQARHLAALRFRMYYLNLLETFFAQFFANVQAPSHPAAWLTLYSSRTLRKLAKRLIQTPWRSDETTLALSHPRELVSAVFGLNLETDEDVRAEEIDAVIAIIERLAEEFTSSATAMEYNAIKHGSRARSAGWKLSLSPSGVAEPLLELAAPFGSHFGYTNAIGEHEHAWREWSQGWDLERDIRLANTISKLLFNLVRTWQIAEPDKEVIRFTFRGLDQKATFRTEAAISHFEGGHPGQDYRQLAVENQKEFVQWLLRPRTESDDATTDQDR